MQFKFLLAVLALVMAMCAFAPAQVQAQDTEFFFKECEGAAVCFKCCQQHGHTVSVALSSGHEGTCVCEKVHTATESH